MRNVPICAVMAFSSLAMAATNAETGEPVRIDFGETRACEPVEFDAEIIPSGSNVRLLAAYAERGYETAWVRVLERGDKSVVEIATPNIRRRSIDPTLAARISARLADDISRNALVSPSDEIPIDGIWYLFTADGKSCVIVPYTTQTARAEDWSRIFATLSGKAASSEAMAWFWLDQLEQAPATPKTSLSAATPDQDVTGATSTLKHPGARLLTILNHRARVSDGRRVIVGEVANNMDTARDGLDVIATFYDANGAVQATDNFSVMYELVPRGARSPFELEVTRTDVVSYTLRIDPGEPIALRPASVRISDHHHAIDEDGDLIVSGTVRNVGKHDEKYVEVQVNLYDEAGGLLAADSDIVGELLRAGATAPFEVMLERPRGYHHYEVQVNPDYRELRE